MEKNGDNVYNEFWAPISEAQNSWIQVGWHEGETCKTYDQMFHEDPSWGITGIDSVEVTGYLMCCLESSDVNGSLSTSESTTPTSAEDEHQTGQRNDEVAPLFHPILYDRDHGWKAYAEAVQFCSQSAPTRVLCPIEV